MADWNNSDNKRSTKYPDLEENIVGTVQRVNFRSDDGQFSVLQLNPEDYGDPKVVVGSCLHFTAGTKIICYGHYTTHPKYGVRFNAVRANEVEPTTTSGLIKYLGSGLLPGIGPKTAKRIVNELGIEALNKIRKNPDCLLAISGISKKKAELISGVLLEKVASQTQERFFVEHDISPNLAKRIIQKYGTDAIPIVQQDPYRLAFEMHGIGFTTADSIALKLGFKLDAPERIRGAIYHTLETARENGNCFLPEEQLFKETKEKLELAGNIDLKPQLNSLINNCYLIEENERIYLKKIYDAEKYVANFVINRSKPFETPLVNSSTLADCIKRAESELGLEFSAEQKLAVKYSTEYPLLIITGGPGCGKTTIINALARTFYDANKVLALAAPTGKAAQRMSQVTGQSAGTIHRLLKYDPRTNDFFYNYSNPIRVGETDFSDGEIVDAVIVDEASMLDILLAKDLFQAIPQKATLILVGDKDQLPSVGPGKVFSDLVSIAKLKIISLNQLFRRSEESAITTVAHSINSGRVPKIPKPDGITKSDAYFIERNEIEDCAKLIESLVAEQIPQKFGIPTDNITVLTPANRGLLGTNELNVRLQNKINPIEIAKVNIVLHDKEYRLGDRVCQRVNNYKIDLFGVFNGDIGIVNQIANDQRSMAVELWDGRVVTYNLNEISQLSLAYAQTVHRSQGSEMPCVVLALHTTHFTLLERQLLYTAVTRAKKLLIIVGNARAIEIATTRLSSKKRFTFLKQRIEEMVE